MKSTKKTISEPKKPSLLKSIRHNLMGAVIVGALLIGGAFVVRGIIEFHNNYVEQMAQKYQLGLLYNILANNVNNCKREM